jgi:hypothetical protein
MKRFLVLPLAAACLALCVLACELDDAQPVPASSSSAQAPAPPAAQAVSIQTSTAKSGYRSAGPDSLRWQRLSASETTLPTVGKPGLEFRWTLLESTDSALAPLVRKLLYAGKTAQAAINTVHANLQDACGAPESQSCEDRRSVSAYQPFAGVVVLVDSSFTFLGGAHGLSGVGYHTIDLASFKELQFGELWDDRDKASALVLEALRNAYQVAPDSALSSAGFLTDTLPPPSAFFVQDSTMNFAWSVYQIAPYSMGQVTVGVPLTVLEPVLSDRAQKLLIQD